MRLAASLAARPVPRSLRRRYALAIGVVVTLQLAILAGMRFLATGPDGGDMCRDIVAVHRLASGVNPYTRIPNCGVLFNLPHPPAYLLLIGPFALLPLPWAAVLWSLVTLGALAGALALLARELRLAPAPWQVFLVLALLVVWPPLLGTLLESQVSPILLLLFALAWLWARRGQSARAGIALGIAGAIRLFPLLAVGYFFLRRDWRAVVTATGSFVLISLVPLPLVGFTGFVDYATREAPATTQFWLAHEHNVSAWGFASLLFTGHRTAPAIAAAPGLVRPLALVLIAAALGALLWLTWIRRARAVKEDELTFLAYLPVMLLASPLTWEHYFLILLLPLAVVAARLGWLPSAGAPRPIARARRVGWLVAGGLALIEMNYLGTLPALPEQMPGVFGPLLFSLPTYALALLLGAFLEAGTSPASRATPEMVVSQAGRGANR